MNADIRRTVQHTGHYVWMKETAEYLISTGRRASTRRSASRTDSDKYAGPCPTVRCRVDRWDDGVVDQATDMEITHEDVEMLRRFVAAFLTVVFELPLSDVTVVDGDKAVLECRVAVTPAAEVTWYVDNVSDPADVTRERFDDMMPSTWQERQAEWDIVVLRREGVRGGDDWGRSLVYLVSIVREVERELVSISRPATKSSTRRTDPHTSAAPLGGDDRKPSALYATQIDAHAADVDASPAHRLVYVGDIIARHVTNQSVGDRIAPAATESCGQLELVTLTSRNAVPGNRLPRRGRQTRGLAPTPAAATAVVCLVDMPAVTFSFRHRTLSESKLVTFTSIGLRHHAYNVNNIWTVNSAECRYIYVFIYIISVSLHAFIRSSYRVFVIEFCVLLHFNQI